PKCKIMQSDNSTEFKNVEVDGYLENLGIKSIHSLAYKPTSQGCIERFNGTIKRKLFQYLTQFKTQRWIDVIPKLTDNYNTSIHSTTGRTPSDMFNGAGGTREAMTRIKEKAQKAIDNTERKFEELKKGDWVRIHTRGGHSFIKSKEVYIVLSKSRPTNPLVQPVYTVQNEQGVASRFGRSELLKVPDPQSWSAAAPRQDHSKGEFFDRQTHMEKLAQQKKNAPKKPPPKPIAKPAATRSTSKKRSYEELSKKHGLQEFSVIVPQAPPLPSTKQSQQKYQKISKKQHGLKEFSID
ncbi:MAG TPA: hypothetical protein VIJ14_03895, partial [Rhabdochlamydiaceae bacterium]